LEKNGKKGRPLHIQGPVTVETLKLGSWIDEPRDALVSVG
jgi:hypothetical protein